MSLPGDLVEDTEVPSRVLMYATSAPGGIAQVVENLRRAGFTSRWRVETVASHRPGGLMKRMVAAMSALILTIVRIVSGQIELLHLHAAMRSSFWRKGIYLVLGRAMGKATVLHLHGSEFKQFFAYDCGPFKQRLVRWVLSRADSVVVLSSSWARYVESVEPAAKISVIPNFAFAPWESPLVRKSPGRVLTCLFLGLLGPRKGVADLLAAVRHVRNQGGEIVLHVGGNGDVDWFRGLVGSLSLEDCVTFHGWVGGDDKWTLLKEADVFVLPSYNEGQPVAIIEAMASGCAIISTKVGGIPEMLDEGNSGRLIEPGDVESLAAYLLDFERNPSSRVELGRIARRKYETHFSPTAVVPLWDALYEQLIRKGRSPRVAVD